MRISASGLASTIAVAIDQPEAARPWIEGARPSYPCLVDRDHHLTDLYNLVNVPQAVWIDGARRFSLHWLQPASTEP